MRETADSQAQLQALMRCRQALQALPQGDLRQYTTTVAMQDAEAVRRALGLGPVNLVGVSYGTRAALEYLRQHPQAGNPDHRQFQTKGQTLRGSGRDAGVPITRGA